jgi:mRNA-degrading endonuclease RelE of RelBE toxin-antitoxin system
MYQVVILSQAEKSFNKLDKPVQLRVADKVDWLAANAGQMIHHQLSSLPDDLQGLCKLRVGDYRLLYWVYHDKKKIVV